MLQACTDSVEYNTENQVKLFELVPSGELLEFTLDSVSRPYSKAIFVETIKDKAHLYILNESLNTISIFDLEAQTLFKQVELAYEGVNGVGNVKGFRAFSPDSLLVISNSPKFFLVNGEGEVVKKYDYGAKNRDVGNTYSTSLNYKKIEVIKENTVALTRMPQGNWNLLTNRDLEQFHPGFFFNTKTETVGELPLTYPKDYFAEGKKEIAYSRCYNGKQLIYSFYADPHVYIHDVESGKVTSQLVSSQYIERIKPMENMDYQSYTKYGVESPYYGTVIYDEASQLYYRFCYIGTELTTDMNARETIKYKPIFSIIIMDKFFQKIGETLFENKYYTMDNFFIYNKGLYLSVNHPNNSKNTEDAFIFERLAVSSL